MVAPVAAPPSLSEFLTMVLAGLEGETARLRAAAIFALSRLTFEFAHTSTVQALLPHLLSTVLELLKEQSREVVTSGVSFIKGFASAMPPAELMPHVPAILTGLLTWSGERKERIRLKVRPLHPPGGCVSRGHRSLTPPPPPLLSLRCAPFSHASCGV